MKHSQDIVLLELGVNFLVTSILAAFAWLMQFVGLPTLNAANAKKRRIANSAFMAFPMLAEAATTIMLLRNPSLPLVVAAVLWLGAIAGTIGFTLAYPRLSLDLLKRWNLLRALCWSARSCLLVAIMMR